jgi:hypothetical protein
MSAVLLGAALATFLMMISISFAKLHAGPALVLCANAFGYI